MRLPESLFDRMRANLAAAGTTAMRRRLSFAEALERLAGHERALPWHEE